MIEKLLNQAIKEGSMIGVYTSPDDISRFEVGFLMGLNEQHYSLQTLDKRGRLDSLQVGLTSEVIRLTTRSPYIDFLRNSSEIRVKDLLRLDRDIPCSFCGAVSAARELNQFVTLTDNYNSLTTGSVVSWDDESVEVDEFDEKGKPEGNVVIVWRSIRRVELFGPSERAIQLLAKGGTS